MPDPTSLGSTRRPRDANRRARRMRALRDGLRDAMEGALQALDDDVLADWARRTEELAGGDGYPPGGERVGGRGSGEPDAALVNAALRGASEDVAATIVQTEGGPRSHEDWSRHEALDRVSDAVEEVERRLAEATAAARRILRLAHYVQATKEPLRDDAQGPGHCRACAETISGIGADRARRGVCPACWVSFTRWKLSHPLEEFALDRGAQMVAFIGWRGRGGTPAPDAPDWRVEDIDRLRQRGELPPQRAVDHVSGDLVASRPDAAAALHAWGDFPGDEEGAEEGAPEFGGSEGES